MNETQMIQYAERAIKPGLDYFKSQMEGNLNETLLKFKYARFFFPQKVHTMLPRATDLDSLKPFPFLTKYDSSVN